MLNNAWTFFYTQLYALLQLKGEHSQYGEER